MTHAEFIKEFDKIFIYDNGQLIRRVQRGPSKPGTILGCPNHKGYLQVKFQNKLHMVHRLIFMYFNGYFPEQVDHINNIKTDNRIENLRAATQSENQFNRPCTVKNKLNHKNIRFYLGKYQVQINENKKRHYLGRYATLEEAIKVADKKRKELHGDFRRS